MSNHGHVNYGDETLTSQVVDGADAATAVLVHDALRVAQEAAKSGAVINNGIASFGGSVIIDGDVTFVGD